MTNFDKAAELILPYIGGCTECDRIGDACLDCIREAKDAVKDIAEAGLLAPDLPEPYWGTPRGATWYLPYHIGDIRRMREHIVAFGHDYNEQSFRLVLTEEETEVIAHTLLAAAQYAKGQENER